MTVLNKKTLWEGKFLRAVLVRYIDGSGVTERDWEAIERVGCDGIVGIVPFTDEGEVVMIRQFRPPINRHVVELPAGLCDPGEKPEDAARRELIEETGYSAGELRFLTEGPLSSGLSAELLTVYTATGLTFVGIGGKDETEHIEVLKVPVERVASEMESMREAGDYIDLKVYGLVELARRSLGK
ncbi:MAG: NUDIX hydrolase [Nitrospiraceae bacterium]|nr:NUDIX hydrolase [Nitrospiraceae bacterium]